VADGLVKLLNKEVAGGNIKPIEIAKNSPCISNPLFTNDSLLFFKGMVDEAVAIKRVLELF
jgi:hypothetical protein